MTSYPNGTVGFPDSPGRHPTFFIIGAPKCGTTALAAWLSRHDNVLLSDPKEPYFFSRDIRSRRAAESSDEYMGLFDEVHEKHHAVGEASTTYLRSKIAVPRILDRWPSARFVVCLRNPVDMVASVHAQLMRSGREDESNLARAWALQEKRRQGEAIPRFALEPRDLQYGDMCSLGAQVRRLLGLVPRDQVHFVFLEDMARAPRQTYLGVLSFLGLPGDGLRSFAVENRRKIPRSMVARRLVKLGEEVKQWLGIRRSFGIGRRLVPLLERDPTDEETTIPLHLREQLNRYFEEDIQLLARLTKRDLSHWAEQVQGR